MGVKEDDNDCDIIDDFLLMLPASVRFPYEFISRSFWLVLYIERNDYLADKFI